MTPEDVIRFAGILRQVVQLRLRRADVLPAIRADAPQVRPAHIEPGIEAFEVTKRGRRLPSAKQRKDARTLHVFRRLAAHQLEDCRREIDGPRLLPDPEPRRNARPRQQKRDAQGGIIEKHAMRELTVFRQAFAMVRHHREDRVPRSFGIHGVEQAPELLVRIRNFAVVGPSGVLLAERRWRIVG